MLLVLHPFPELILLTLPPEQIKHVSSCDVPLIMYLLVTVRTHIFSPASLCSQRTIHLANFLPAFESFFVLVFFFHIVQIM